MKIGLIGLGQMGRNHLRVLSILKGVDIAFVADINEEEARPLAATYGANFHRYPAEALQQTQLDGVIICTPTKTHEPLVRAAAERVPNIFVEKPLTDELVTSVSLRDFVAERGLNVQVGFIERFNPAVQQLKTLLGESDRVVSVDFTRTNKLSSRIKDVDVIIDLMIHDIDLALYLNGPVETVTAHGVFQGNMVAFASAVLKHSGGRLSRILASRITDKKMRVVQATCSDMFVNCELLRKEIVISRQATYGHREGSPLVITAVEEILAVRPEEALLSELQSFIANCRNPRSVAAPGVDDAVNAIAVCDRIQRDIRDGATARSK